MATRRWWRRRDGGDDDADDLVPMDTQEQEELVRSLEQKQAQQSRRWRRVFAGFLLGYAAFLVYSSFHHAWFPWELRYHAYFMEDLPAPLVIIADWIAALACLFAVKGLLQNSGPSKKWMWYSCYIGFLVAIFWTYYILRYMISVNLFIFFSFLHQSNAFSNRLAKTIHVMPVLFYQVQLH
ncbi:hypothetical protein PVAP13_5NG236800 [Panicum virgatum]|uniref:Uncharacterized protein n=1 Tax=Panicum virgatum TaxID=38727 RepID=A0A8T0RTW3_PANVG|nr:hypothetical protein PVAP13_5NG236800 [Panicum virgatum]